MALRSTYHGSSFSLLILQLLLMAASVCFLACSAGSCPRVHLYNCARFLRVRKKTDTCKFSFAVPAMNDGTCPDANDLSLAYVEVAKLTQKYEDLEAKVSELSGKEDVLEKSAPQVTVRMQKDGSLRDDSGITAPAPKTSGENDESFTVTITAHLTTERDVGAGVKDKKSRKTRSVCQHDVTLDSVRVSSGSNIEHSEHTSTVSKTSDGDPISENPSIECKTCTVEVDQLRKENRSLKKRVSKLEERLEWLESNFKDLFGT